MKKLNAICLLLMCSIYGQVFASTQLNFRISNKVQENVTLPAEQYIDTLANRCNLYGRLLHNKDETWHFEFRREVCW